jgi:zinc-ribbon domain
LPYCRKCGTKLEDDARFCHRCGTPVEPATYAPPSPPTPKKRIRNDLIIIGTTLLISILVAGVIIVTLLAVPFSTVTFGQTYQDNTSNISKLNLNVQTERLRVNVFTQNASNNNFLITLDGIASKTVFDNSNSPIQVSFYNDTKGNELTITAKITESAGFSILNANCNIYLNPALSLNLNVTSQAGQVSLTADKPSTFESLKMQSAAGTVGANLQNITIAGNVTLKTQAGNVDLRMSQVNVEGNNTVALQTNAGSVTMDITQTKTFQGNLQVNAVTDLGSVNVGLVIDDDVGAQLISQTNSGSIQTDLQNFSGNQSPVQSDNYPSLSNIDINSKTNLGSININAVYQSSSGPIIKN